MKTLIIALVSIICFASCSKNDMLTPIATTDTTAAPLAIYAKQTTYQEAPTHISQKVTVIWNTNADTIGKTIDHYEFYVDSVVFAYTTKLSYQHLFDFSVGWHKFAVRAITTDGMISEWKQFEFLSKKN